MWVFLYYHYLEKRPVKEHLITPLTKLQYKHPFRVQEQGASNQETMAIETMDKK